MNNSATYIAFYDIEVSTKFTLMEVVIFKVC